jgi:hypothetical protein
MGATSQDGWLRQDAVAMRHIVDLHEIRAAARMRDAIELRQRRIDERSSQ